MSQRIPRYNTKTFPAKVSLKRKNTSQKMLVGIGSLILLVMIGGVTYSLVGMYQRKYAIEQEKEEFKRQIAQIQQESQELAQIREFITTREYQEREARQRLDLSFPGEEVRIVTPSSIVDNLSDDDVVRVLREPKSEEMLKAETNPQKWWAFFFDKQRL